MALFQNLIITTDSSGRLRMDGHHSPMSLELNYQDVLMSGGGCTVFRGGIVDAEGHRLMEVTRIVSINRCALRPIVAWPE